MNAVTTQADIDAELERDIDAAYEKMVRAPSDAESRAAWNEMALLLYRRSPRQIHKMELERRLLRKKVVA